MKRILYGDQDGETCGYSFCCPLTEDLTSSACVCRCVVNSVRATAATLVLLLSIQSPTAGRWYTHTCTRDYSTLISVIGVDTNALLPSLLTESK